MLCLDNYLCKTNVSSKLLCTYQGTLISLTILLAHKYLDTVADTQPDQESKLVSYKDAREGGRREQAPIWPFIQGSMGSKRVLFEMQ